MNNQNTNLVKNTISMAKQITFAEKRRAETSYNTSNE